MRKTTHSCAEVTALLVVLLSLFSHAYAAGNEDTYELVSGFAECAAIQNILAMTVTSSKEEYLNHFLHQTANGALIAAMEFSDYGGYKKDLVDSLYEGHFSKLVALKKAAIELGDPAEWNHEIDSKMSMCGELNKIQTEIIKEKRKQIYAK